MRKYILAVLSLLFLATGTRAQNTTAVSASHIQGLGNTALLASGQLCFQGTDQNNNIISFQQGGSGPVITSQFCVPVTDGAITTFNLPNPANTSPVNIRYHITILNNLNRVVADFPGAYLCIQAGACTTPYTFNFDNCLSSGACIANPIPITQGPAGPAGPSSLPCTLTALSVQFDNAGTFGCIDISSYSASSHTLNLTASGTSTTPFTVNSFSSSQTSSIAQIINAGSPVYSGGVFTVSGFGTGNFTPGHNQSLVNIQQENQSTFGLTLTNRSAVGSAGELSDLHMGLDNAGEAYIYAGNQVGDGNGIYSGILWSNAPGYASIAFRISAGLGQFSMNAPLVLSMVNTGFNSPTTRTPLGVYGAFGQTADIFQVGSSTGSIYSGFNNVGGLYAPSVQITGITGSTQCLHASTTGQITGTGSDCGSGGGGGTPCTLTALSVQFNNSGAFGCIDVAEYSATSHQIIITAASNSTTPLYIVPASSSPTIAVADINNGSTDSSNYGGGLFRVRGIGVTGTGSPALTNPPLVMFQAKNQSSIPLVLWNETAGANNGAVVFPIFNDGSSQIESNTFSLNSGQYGQTAFSGTYSGLANGMDIIITSSHSGSQPISHLGLNVPLGFYGSSSGTSFIVAQAAAGSGLIYTLPVQSGCTAIGTCVFAVSASSPITLNSTTGNLSIASIPLTDMATQAADTVLMNASGSSAAPTAVGMPTSGTNGCAGTTNALTYNTTSHGFGCNVISGGGGSSALSSITPATTQNSVSNGNNYGQVWNWQLTTNSVIAMAFGESSASTGTGTYILEAKTLAGSTASPMLVTNSLTGSQTLCTLCVLPVWNTTGVVDAGIFENATITAAGTGALLMDLQASSTTQFSVDKAGNANAASSLSTGTSPSTACGTANDCIALAEDNTTPTCGSGNDVIKANLTAHAIQTCLNGGSMYNVPQTICNVQIALTTGSITGGSRATNTGTCTGLNTSTDRIDCSFVGDTNAVTGYAPSSTGAIITLKKWMSANTINIDQMNNTTNPITPGAATVACWGVR